MEFFAAQRVFQFRLSDADVDVAGRGERGEFWLVVIGYEEQMVFIVIREEIGLSNSFTMKNKLQNQELAALRSF